MRFSLILLGALSLGIAGGFGHVWYPIIFHGINITYAGAVVSGILLLFLSAILFSLKGWHIDIVVASESIVAYGIASLTGGVAIGLTQVSHLLEEKSPALDSAQIWWAATPFIEGIFIAAIAPILAAVLRNMASEPDVALAHGGAVANVLPDLDKLLEVGNQLAAFKSAMATTVESMTLLNQETGKYNSELSSAKDSMKGMNAAARNLHDVSGKLKAHLEVIAGLGDTVLTISNKLPKDKAESLAEQLTAARNSIKGMGEAAQNAKSSIAQLSGFGALNKEVGETVKLLRGLQQIIASFQGFIGRDRRAA